MRCAANRRDVGSDDVEAMQRHATPTETHLVVESTPQTSPHQDRASAGDPGSATRRMKAGQWLHGETMETDRTEAAPPHRQATAKVRVSKRE